MQPKVCRFWIPGTVGKRKRTGRPPSNHLISTRFEAITFFRKKNTDKRSRPSGLGPKEDFPDANIEANICNRRLLFMKSVIYSTKSLAPANRPPGQPTPSVSPYKQAILGHDIFSGKTEKAKWLGSKSVFAAKCLTVFRFG